MSEDANKMAAEQLLIHLEPAWERRNWCNWLGCSEARTRTRGHVRRATTPTTCGASCARRAAETAPARGTLRRPPDGPCRRVTACVCCGHAGAATLDSGTWKTASCTSMKASARQLVLVRAIEDVDTQGKLLSEVEREQLERDALEASRASPPAAWTSRDYLQQRARRMLAAVENRNPRIAACRTRSPGAAGCCGAAARGLRARRRHRSHRQPAPGEHAVAAAAGRAGVEPRHLRADRRVRAVAAAHWRRAWRWPAVQRWLAGVPASGRRTGPAARRRPRALPPAMAAGRRRAAVALVASNCCTCAPRAGRWGWRSPSCSVAWCASTGSAGRARCSGVDQVHACLSALFAPVVALLPFDAFSVADLQRMAFRSGAAIGVDEARRWVWMYVALLFVVVMLPRRAAGGVDGWQRRRHGRAVAHRPARSLLRAGAGARQSGTGHHRLLARDGPARATRCCACCGRSPTGRRPRRRRGRVLSTAKGDVLRVFEVPAGFQPPAPAVTAHGAAARAAAQAWLQDLLGVSRRRRAAQERDAVQAALADTDLMLLVPASSGDVQEATRLLHWVAQPALVLAPGDEVAVPRRGAAARAGGGSACRWRAARRIGCAIRALLDAAAARMATSKRAGFERIAATWKDRNAVRFAKRCGCWPANWCGPRATTRRSAARRWACATW